LKEIRLKRPLNRGLDEGGRRKKMAVIAQPQRITGLVSENHKEKSEERTTKNQSIMDRIFSFLFPEWLIRMGEESMPPYVTQMGEEMRAMYDKEG
jgi:hypothetical protein